MKDPLKIDKLKEQQRWVCWKTELNDDGKPSCCFYHPETEQRMQDTDELIGTDFKTALSYVKAGAFEGVALALHGTNITGLALCNCIKDRQITPSAQKLLNMLHDTYTEIDSDRGSLCFLVQSSFQINRETTNMRLYGTGYMPLSMTPYKVKNDIRDMGFSFANIVGQIIKDSNEVV